MMDETAYRQILSATAPNACPFEKSLLSGCAACSRAERCNIAEREIVNCTDAQALARCIALRDQFRLNFTFALGRPHIEGPLPHAQEMRMQCGGLKGLQAVLDDSDQVKDVAALLDMCQQKFGSLSDFPYEQIVRLAKTLYKAR